jgi:hypothetical protein
MSRLIERAFRVSVFATALLAVSSAQAGPPRDKLAVLPLDCPADGFCFPHAINNNGWITGSYNNRRFLGVARLSVQDRQASEPCLEFR